MKIHPGVGNCHCYFPIALSWMNLETEIPSSCWKLSTWDSKGRNYSLTVSALAKCVCREQKLWKSCDKGHNNFCFLATVTQTSSKCGWVSGCSHRAGCRFQSIRKLWCSENHFYREKSKKSLPVHSLSNTVKDFIGLTGFSDSIWLLSAWKYLGVLALAS